jgi:sigma-B regulation protein RsbU (phosphoserine phosphatase)
MWNIESTIRLMNEMSRSTDPGELIRLFFDHVRRSIPVQRALVLSNAGLSSPQYRVVENVNCDDEPKRSGGFLNELREGGLLAKLLYRGNFQNIARFTPDPSDPDFDLLKDSGSLVAIPLFEKGVSTGMVVVLTASSQPHNSANLCALAMMTSLLGRAIETQKLADQLQLACGALDSELKAAADVQRWLLPSLPALDDIGIAASYRTARYSGGDYYDVGRLPDARLGVLIADVSGKGAAAAVLMAVLRSIVHDEVDRTKMIGPAALLNYADSRLRALGLSERGAFVTAFCGVLDPVTGELVYSCAGHNPPRLLRVRDRTVTSLSGATTFPLGLVNEPHTYMEETAVLTPGDLALFYTDGITEARSPACEFFGVERLDQILCNLPDPITADAAVEGIAKAVARFEGDGTPADDQTLVAVVARGQHAFAQIQRIRLHGAPP